MQPNIADFAVSVIANPPTDPLNGTELTITSTEGLLMPAVPFDAVIAPLNVLPTFSRVEKVTVTEVDGDVLTITRAQGGTSKKTILAGYLLYNAIFADDILGAYSRSNHTGTQLASTISNFAAAALAAIPDATLEVVGKVRQTVFNVKDYGAEGDGVTDDYAAIMDAIADADAAGGGTVYFPPGCYVVSQALIYDKTASTESIPAPSLVGAPGRSGPSPDFVSDRDLWYQSCVVTIRCSDSFPLGHYVIDWLGPIAQDRAICGYVMQGIVIDCNSRGAGMRNFNWFNGSVRDVLIDNNPQAPNPTYAGAYASPTSNTGAFMSSGKPTQNSFFNTIERVYVREAALDGFQFASGAGSFDLATNCLANNNGRFGYNVEDKTTLVECIAQTNARTKGQSGADFRVGRYDVSLIGCKAFSGKPYFGNGIKVAGGASSVAHVIGCTFYGAINEDQDMTEQDAAVVQLQGSLQNIEFIGCHFITGNDTFTSDFVYLSASATGRATFVGCQFITEQGDPLTNVPVNANGNDNVLSFTNCHGLNPEATKTYATITNAQQSVQLGVTGGLPTGGTFTLTFGGQTTAPIAYNASAAAIQTALAALSSIGSGNVACSGGSVHSFPVFVTFQGTLGNAAQSLMTSNGAGLTGGNVITIQEVLPGGPNVTLDAKNGDFQIIGMSGNLTPTIASGSVKGQEVVYKFVQDSVGGRTFTAPSNLKTRSGGFSLSPAVNAVDFLTTQWDGSNWQEVSRGVEDGERVLSIVSSATPSVNTDIYKAVSITALATDITSMTSGLSGTPRNFQKLIYRIKDTGTPRGITWGAGFVAEGKDPPTVTVANKVLTVGFLYDSVKAAWGCVASIVET